MRGKFYVVWCCLQSLKEVYLISVSSIFFSPSKIIITLQNLSHKSIALMMTISKLNNWDKNATSCNLSFSWNWITGDWRLLQALISYTHIQAHNQGSSALWVCAVIYIATTPLKCINNYCAMWRNILHISRARKCTGKSLRD